MNTEKTLWVAIGIIVKAHGVSGEVKVFPLTDVLNRFSQLSSVCIRTKDNTITRYTITNVRKYLSSFYLKFREITTRNQVDKLKDAELVILKNEIHPPPKGSFYIFDIVGLTVINERGEIRGKVTDVFSRSPYDIYAVNWNGKEVLIPAVHEFVRNIDIEQRILYIIEQDGLFE